MIFSLSEAFVFKGCSFSSLNFLTSFTSTTLVPGPLEFKLGNFNNLYHSKLIQGRSNLFLERLVVLGDLLPETYPFPLNTFILHESNNSKSLLTSTGYSTTKKNFKMLEHIVQQIAIWNAIFGQLPTHHHVHGFKKYGKKVAFLKLIKFVYAK